jgi:signal transduction histidine kinase
MTKFASNQIEPLHSLIAQASALVRSLTKARGDSSELKEQARHLMWALDAAYPDQAAVQQTFALVRQLADGGDFEAVRRQAQILVKDRPESANPRRRKVPASSRDVDAWILDMFRATESAIPRETLVDDFIQRYRRERRIVDQATHNGPWLFVFEAERGQGEMVAIRPLFGAGVHPDAFAGHCREMLPHWRNDPFLSYVFAEQRDIDLWYAHPFQGSPLFDGLLDVRRRFGGEADYWLNAAVLPGDERHETRAVFILYRNSGDPLFPEPPPGTRQDQRLLTVLALAWRQLEHQVRGLARISEADRRDLINLIAPGLLHHEIGFNMRTAYGQAYEQFQLLKRIAEETGREDVAMAVRYAHGVAGLVLKLYRITDVFNNLDKRGQVEDSTLDKLFSDIKILLHHRLGHAHTELYWDQAEFAEQTLHTDVVLLTQALVNILNNALNALTEADTPPPRRIQVILDAAGDGKLSLCLFNNGPSIAPQQARDIFRRGYTTRRQGHGQGLYLSRLVAHYLGGELNLIETPALPVDFHTGFRLTLKRHLPAEQGVARVAD